jgi:two-component system response regulator AtoC
MPEVPMADSAARETILIVDDERGPRESLRMILSPSYRVLQADRAAEALERLRAAPVDLVTLDLNMPGVHGVELMRSLRAEFPQTEIVIITGCASVESAVEGIRAQVCDYIEKPFDVAQVSAAVDRGLRRKRAREGAARLAASAGPRSDGRSKIAPFEASASQRNCNG